MSTLALSFSGLEAYQDCPRYYFLSREAGLPKRTNHPMLAGVEIHRHIAQLYKPTATPRVFYYTSKGDAIRAWIGRWQRALETARAAKFLKEDKESKRNSDLRFRRVGIICIARYWDDNFKEPRPLQVEHRYECPLAPGVKMIGRIDQLREVSLDYIRGHRPELIENGRLKEGYDPVVIVDFKSGRKRYDWSSRRFRSEPTFYDKVRNQFELHEDLQVTGFTYLYHRTTGKMPVGFVMYLLRGGNTFFTFREERDYATLFGVINHHIDSVAAESFPKHIDEDLCPDCLYQEECREDRFFILSEPEGVPGAGDFSIPRVIPNLVQKSGSTQLRLKFKIPRVKREAPTVRPISETPQHIVLRSFPWDALPPEEELKLRTAEESEEEKPK